MKDTVTLTAKEQQRLMILNRCTEGSLSPPEAACLLGCSTRQLRRLLAHYRVEGAAALAHGNRGRPPAHTLPATLREQVLVLAGTTYRDCNDSHLVELLAEREGIGLSRATLQRWRSAAGLRSPRHRRPPQHRSRRARMPQAGLMLQWDGSSHRWLEDRGPRLTLVGAIDDATGEVVAATFREQEDAQGYLLVLRSVLATHGIPAAIYRDRHGIFERREQEPWTRDEELAGEPVPTQVGRALALLGIQSIAAHSPQAKGRIERVWGTLQDRLVAELRLAGAATPAEAEVVLQGYLPRFNARFRVPADDPQPAYRPLPADVDLEAVCCFAYLRTVAADNTVTFGHQQIQIQPTPARASYARLKVEVREHLDGRLTVWHHVQRLATRPAPPTPAQLRARKGPRPAPTPVAVAPSPALPAVLPHPPAGPHKPAPDHPWRKEARTKSLSS